VVLAAAAGGVLLAVGMPMVAAVSPAEAAFPGQNGKIAFTSSRDGNFEIYTMNPNGQGVDNLTNNPAEDGQPNWSPDGNKIAFYSYRDGNSEIYTMNANGQGVDRLTNNSAVDFEPAWSPGGGKIAFSSKRDGDYEIYTMNANGQGVDRLTNNTAEDSSPAWSPDGNKIAFVSNRDNNSEIYTMNANGQGVENLTKNPGLDQSPAWSPEGNKIAFYSERSGDSLIYTMNPNGQGLDPITTKNDYDPDWQPLSPAPNPTPPNPTPPNNDTTPPKVIKTYPKANAKAVAPTVNLKATFSKDMKASTINKSTFKLSKKGSTSKIAATVSYSEATDKATLNPTKALQKGATYKAVVTSGAKDAAGDPLDQNTAKAGLQQKRWVFAVKK
jgi:TolB protein